MLDQDFENKQEEEKAAFNMSIVRTHSPLDRRFSLEIKINFYQSNVGETPTAHDLDTAASATTDRLPLFYSRWKMTLRG